MMMSESAKQLPHRETKQGMILHSFSLYEKLQTLNKKGKKVLEKHQRNFFLAQDIFKLQDSLLWDIVDDVFINAKN